MTTEKQKPIELQRVKKIEGAIINGVKYHRETDFARDDTANLIRKFKKYDEYQAKIKEILNRRLGKLEANKTENKDLIKSIKGILK